MKQGVSPAGLGLTLEGKIVYFGLKRLLMKRVAQQQQVTTALKANINSERLSTSEALPG